MNASENKQLALPWFEYAKEEAKQAIDIARCAVNVCLGFFIK